MSSIAIIDYGMGNLHSIKKAIQHVTDDTVQVTADHDVIMSADRVVLPGVGAIRDCMGEMRKQGVADVAMEAAKSKPFLGICIGMQALLSHSDENNGVACFDLFPGNIHHFPKKIDDQSGELMKIPHMGWNQVTQNGSHPLWANIPQDSRFYFVHSYYLPTDNFAHTVGSCHYAAPFVAALAKDNVFAVQFHPEKSHTVGLQLLENFTQWNG
ncbi:MAG: imidazole glycerol phosphate synthase subunit HisH [Methylococcales bacterium]|jgi:imidazole glycerol-phosphate synthase subunit HisH|nr:imidazole glycerol phosphate synthase subunit HisH [Methylococcales bacterium]MBT7444322.1 imidazole glycerol phosphate synthase subunit HisH [Methylococcales bacterium]